MFSASLRLCVFFPAFRHCGISRETALLAGMETIPCRDCATPVSGDAAVCPHCGAPRPALREWNGAGFEWKSQFLWMGMPLVHVAFGNDRDGRLRTARGVIAIGQRAVGGFAMGIMAAGFISVGVVSIGVVSFGVVSIGALAAAGVNALAPFALGVFAVGFTAAGVAAFGWKVLFSVTK